MEEKPSTSKDVSNQNDVDDEKDEQSREDQRTNSETYLSIYSDKSRLHMASTGIDKSKPCKPDGKFGEKKRRKRKTGRVEKQRKPPMRRQVARRAPRRRPRGRCEKKRSLSVSTMYSRLSSSGLLTPPCERCGHRCCRRRYGPNVTYGKKRKAPIKRRRFKRIRRLPIANVQKSESIQVGSCCKMLSPLNLKSNNLELEERLAATYREITPEMIYEALKRLSMWRQNVETDAIFDFIQKNYPVNQDKEELTKELLEKLEVAVIVGIVKRTSNDTWSLCGALERRKFNKTHVTLFWKIYSDTMKPIRKKENENMQRENITRDRHTLRIFDYEIL